jgi:hypothetical protein
MPEMPIDPEFGRFINGLKDTADGGVEVDLDMDESDMEELPDGSVVVSMEKDYKTPAEDEDFYQNLADVLDPLDMSSIALRYLDLIEKDKEDRKGRDKQYEEGLRRTGMGNDAPGGANFQGASKVVHPIMVETCIDFASRAIKELFPPDGPVRTQILGEVTPEKTEVAERKRDYMNWQLTEQIEEYRDEQEQMLTQLPLGGSQYLKMYWDEKKRRPCAEFVPIDNIYLPFAAANFYTAQRVTEVHEITDFEYKQRIARGLYRDTTFIRSTLEPEQSAAEKANDKIEGKSMSDNVDGLRNIYHVYTWLELEEDQHSKGEWAPYIMMIDAQDNELVGLYRNWEEGDETMTKLDWIVEFKFIPWRGAYAVGLPHIIGGMSAALTGALRALLDTAHINNSATMMKLKGGKISGQSDSIDVTQVIEIEGAPGVDDVRKIAMPLPFNPPSAVLFELLGWLTQQAKGVVTTAEEKIADVTSNAPVGTTQALIEQGAAVFSAIHARLHESQKRVLQILGRINRWYIDDQAKGDVVSDLPVAREDFERNSDVVPVSDPHIFSETQRIAQMQTVKQLAAENPDLFDRRAVISRMLKQLKVPNIAELMPAAIKPGEMNAIDENMAMALGKPAFAYPGQDHLAHLMSHLNFSLDPTLGSNPIIAMNCLPQEMEHMKQHMVLWYKDQMTQYAVGDTGLDLNKYDDRKMTKPIDQTVAVASEHVKMDSQKVFEKVMPALQQLGQTIAQMTQQRQQQMQIMDPESQAVLQASMAETQRRAMRDQNDIQLEQARLQTDVAMNTENNLTKERMKAAEITVDGAKLQREQQETALSLQEAAQRNLGGFNG